MFGRQSLINVDGLDTLERSELTRMAGWVSDRTSSDVFAAVHLPPGC